MFEINFTDLIASFSYGLDCVEHELLGATSDHAKRIGYMSYLIGKKMGMCPTRLLDLAACAMLHDNALTQYIYSELASGRDVLKNPQLMNFGPHCTMGEENLKCVPLNTHEKDVILYHHENVNGTGPFGKNAEETSLYAQIIHITDTVDVANDLSSADDDKITRVYNYVKKQNGRFFSDKMCKAFLAAVTPEVIKTMGGNMVDVIKRTLPGAMRSYSNDDVRRFAEMFAQIIDYKSDFTMHHSIGVADKAEAMSRFYGYSEDMQTVMYFTGAVHDVGKLVITNDILEKPGKLTESEFVEMKNHAWYSFKILTGIGGLGKIVDWAAFHYEKLNGKGYPFGKKANELDFNDRLMACIDIYQALGEKRPYKEPLTHAQCMAIMKKMVDNSLIDGKIVNDIDTVFGGKTDA